MRTLQVANAELRSNLHHVGLDLHTLPSEFKIKFVKTIAFDLVVYLFASPIQVLIDMLEAALVDDDLAACRCVAL